MKANPTLELASLLNGRKYRKEISTEEAEQAKVAGLVVVYGASDDLMEFAGAIDDEIDCYNGGTAFITPNGILQNECENERCPYCKREAEKAVTIKAVWDKDGYSWVYETDIPHETFEIFEDGNKYCRGIIFALADVKGGAA